jgi:hypothetical protein
MTRSLTVLAAIVLAAAVAACGNASSGTGSASPAAKAYSIECMRLGSAVSVIASDTKHDMIVGQGMTSDSADSAKWEALLRSAAHADTAPPGSNEANRLSGAIGKTLVDLDMATITDAGYSADVASATDTPGAWAKQWGTFQTDLTAAKADCHLG